MPRVTNCRSPELQNKAGEYIKPSLESCQAAFAAATVPDDLRVSVHRPGGKGSYPVVTFTWILAHAKYYNPKAAAATERSLEIRPDGRAKGCAPLGYIPLPESIRQAGLEAVNKINAQQTAAGKTAGITKI